MGADFFEHRESYRTFEEVVAFVHDHFVFTPTDFVVGEKQNSVDENQRACCVLAYAIRMGYTFEQTKALFGEHDHLAISLPHLKRDRNIYQLNTIYIGLLQSGRERNLLVKDFPDLIQVPVGCLVAR